MLLGLKVMLVVLVGTNLYDCRNLPIKANLGVHWKGNYYCKRHLLFFAFQHVMLKFG